MDKIFYNIFIRLYPLAVALIAPFNEKAHRWLTGRKNIFAHIRSALSNNNAPVVWMHCASLGEFEQGRPVLEKLKEVYPQHKVVLTFFSPSGYEVQKNNKLAHHTFYLPIDSKKNATAFLDIVKPSLVLFVKYEYWYHYLKQVNERKIPLLMVSGIFLPSFSFFKWYGTMRREMLRFFTHFFVQTGQSQQLLQSININNVSMAGDTRFDRVLQVASTHQPMPPIERFINQHTTVVAGSTWTDDDEVLDHFANTHADMRFIIAPHDIDNDRLAECTKLYKHSILYSAWLEKFNHNEPLDAGINTLIIDNMGQLKFLYYYAAVCYVGGGFNSAGIHNILEAAVYGKPVLFGPAHEKFAEAQYLIGAGAAFDVEDSIELEDQLETLLTDEKLYAKAGRIAGAYVQANAGATSNIINYIQANRLLIN